MAKGFFFRITFFPFAVWMSDEALRHFVRELVLSKSKVDAKQANDLIQLTHQIHNTKMLKIREIQEKLLNQKLVLERYQTYFACLVSVFAIPSIVIFLGYMMRILTLCLHPDVWHANYFTYCTGPWPEGNFLLQYFWLIGRTFPYNATYCK